MIRKIVKVLYAAVRGGAPGFNKGETALLNYVIAALPSEDAAVLQTQIAAVWLVHRQNERRLVAAYYGQSEFIGALPYGGYEYCLAKVTYTNRGLRHVTSMVLHDGRLMSLEGYVPVSAEEVEDVVNVELHPNVFVSTAMEIDAGEHSENV